jgi:hypothetical protein
MGTYRKYRTKAQDAEPDNPERLSPHITAWDKAEEMHGSYLSCGFPKEFVDPNLGGSYELPPSREEDSTVKRAPYTFNDKPKTHDPAPGKVGAE